jgi:hypothetical protein
MKYLCAGIGAANSASPDARVQATAARAENRTQVFCNFDQQPV